MIEMTGWALYVVLNAGSHPILMQDHVPTEALCREFAEATATQTVLTFAKAGSERANSRGALGVAQAWCVPRYRRAVR